jgi:hypothetical protein
MKQQEINVPDGYYIDKEKSTSDEIVFKKILDLADSWEDIFFIQGYYVNDDSEVVAGAGKTTNDGNRNMFSTKKQALASLALAQLSQLRDIYRQGWTPNYKHSSGCIFAEITYYKSELVVEERAFYDSFLSFQDVETAELFLENFRNLIEEAKPLMS